MWDNNVYLFHNTIIQPELDKHFKQIGLHLNTCFAYDDFINSFMNFQTACINPSRHFDVDFIQKK